MWSWHIYLLEIVPENSSTTIFQFPHFCKKNCKTFLEKLGNCFAQHCTAGTRGALLVHCKRAPHALGTNFATTVYRLGAKCTLLTHRV